MRISEAAQAVGCTRRAIKYYEEQGLLPVVDREENGYRDYSDEDIRILHEIQAYRKLGISIDDIRRLLKGGGQDVLDAVLLRKRQEQQARQEEIDALEAFIRRRDAPLLDEALDFETIAQAMRAQLPGVFGRYIAAHFAPYLQIRITTDEQQEAYQTILAFWDDPVLRLPLLFRLSMRLSGLSGAAANISAAQMDAQLQAMLHPDEAAYARLKAQTLRTVRLRENPLIRYSPVELAKRQMLRALQTCGYNDVFIPAMKRLSPAYRAYHDALQQLNERLCRDLGLHYDADWNLVVRKQDE